MVHHDKAGSGRHQPVAQAVQSYPSASGPQHAAACSRNSNQKWPRIWGLDTRICCTNGVLISVTRRSGAGGAGPALCLRLKSGGAGSIIHRIFLAKSSPHEHNVRTSRVGLTPSPTCLSTASIKHNSASITIRNFYDNRPFHSDQRSGSQTQCTS